MTLRAIVVDDEPLARRRLRRLLAAHADIDVVGEAANGDEAVGLCLRERPAVVFLDIRMPGSSGIEALCSIRAGWGGGEPPQAVFTTAHREHAIEAFELEGADYLLKPVQAERLALTLDRLRAREAGRAADSSGSGSPGAPTGSPAPEPPPATASESGYLAAVEGDRIISLSHDEVALLAVEGSTTWASTARGKYRVRATLGELEERLPSPPFVRVSRACLVHLAWIEHFEPEDSGTFRARLRSPLGLTIGVSRRRARRLRELLGW